MSARTIHSHHNHLGWNRDLTPVAHVAPGETWRFECRDASNGQIGPGDDVSALDQYDTERVNPVTGPVVIDGARPGDALRITIVELAPAGWGWTAILPGFGLLADEFPDPWLNIATYDAGSVDFLPGIVLPTRPFIGTAGVAPAEAGTHSVIPPRRVGGNMDCRDLIEGATLTLPVEVDGALFSVGDPHAAQGDGEVCGTAIETPMDIALRFDVVSQAAPAFPMIDVPAGPLRRETDSGWWVTTGIGPDLMAASRDALRGMIDRVTGETGLTPEQAYALCSVSADLRISEIVDAPNWVVSMAMPVAIFR